MISLLSHVFVLTLLFVSPSFASDEGGFAPLFDGKSIDDWVKRGVDATYEVVDGAIVGTSVLSTPNTFLCTPRDYGDFELRLELKVDLLLNSGIQIRSHCHEEERVEQGVGPDGEEWKKTIPAGRVHGYQVEIDPSARAYSGGIYDEARRGWLYDLSGDKHRSARTAFNPDGWNEYRILVQGDHIQTWVNGVPAADLHDGQNADGFIALQVHGIGDDQSKVGKQVRWRNLRIKEL